jgi:hypothetical protein
VAADQSRDVIVHRFAAVDALTGSAIGDRWSVWLGEESHGSFDNEGEALELARALAAETGRSAWLHEEGHAPIQISYEDEHD